MLMYQKYQQHIKTQLPKGHFSDKLSLSTLKIWHHLK